MPDAVFVYGYPPLYYASDGAAVRALVEADRPRRNPWTGEARSGGPYDDSSAWFVASVLLGSGLARAGFRAISTGDVDSPPVEWPW